MQVDGEAWLVQPGNITVNKLPVQVCGCGLVVKIRIDCIIVC